VSTPDDLVRQIHERPDEDAPRLAYAADASLVGPVDEAGLVRAIIADPDDIVARRVYADWLEEHGAEQLAELVRLCCEDRGAHIARYNSLTRSLKQAVVATAPGYTRLVRFNAAGLPVVTMAMRKVLTKGLEPVTEAWLKRHHVHGLDIHGRVADPNRLAALPAFGWARCLRFRGMHLRDKGVAGLAGSPHLGGLLELDVYDNRLGAPGLVELFRDSRLPGLCSLDLGGNRPGAEGLRALAESAAGGGLARLDLLNTHPERAAVAVLAGSPGLRQLRHLNLSYNRLDDDALGLLAESPHLPRLASLDLSSNEVTDAGVAALVGSALLSRLRWLSLVYNPVSDPRPLARALPPGCRLQLSTYFTRAELQAEVGEILGGRLTWR
jgi:uncharacterized protein (TIGR02996 family)